MMPLIPDPVQIMRVQMSATLMMAEASAVIWMRTLGMMGAWSVPASENTRMVEEKQKAFTLAMTAAVNAAADGPLAQADAALKPIRRATKSNVRRLTRKGPRLPKA